MKRTIIHLSATLMLFVTAGGCLATEYSATLVGELARLTFRESGGDKVIGQVIAIDGEIMHLRLPSGSSEISVSLPAVARIEVKMHKRRGPFRNAGIGFASGVLAGIAGISVCELDDKSCFRGGVAAGGVLASVGAVVGFIYGMKHTDSWEPRMLPDLRMSGSRSMTVRLAKSF